MAKVKVKLGARPESFTHPVEVKLHDGETGVIKMTYIYRTRKQFANLVDDIFEEAKMKQPVGDAQMDLSMSKFIAERDGTSIEYIMRIATGWDLESEFNRENVTQLCDELPGVALAVIDAYRAASLEGRLGN
jgi:Phage tail assembly chaperone